LVKNLFNPFSQWHFDFVNSLATVNRCQTIHRCDRGLNKFFLAGGMFFKKFSKVRKKFAKIVKKVRKVRRKFEKSERMSGRGGVRFSGIFRKTSKLSKFSKKCRNREIHRNRAKCENLGISKKSAKFRRKTRF
jgi:hypothetical protein